MSKLFHQGRLQSPLDEALARKAPVVTEKEATVQDFEKLLGGKDQLLAYLAEQANQEQGWFWSRFGAFATLHAGLLVLITSDAVKEFRPSFAVAGLCLAGLWAAVQGRSLTYVVGSKKPFHRYLMILGLRSPDEQEFAFRPWITASTTLGS